MKKNESVVWIILAVGIFLFLVVNVVGYIRIEDKLIKQTIVVEREPEVITKYKTINKWIFINADDGGVEMECTDNWISLDEAKMRVSYDMAIKRMEELGSEEEGKVYQNIRELRIR